MKSVVFGVFRHLVQFSLESVSDLGIEEAEVVEISGVWIFILFQKDSIIFQKVIFPESLDEFARVQAMKGI
jgi:hypothetical protein